MSRVVAVFFFQAEDGIRDLVRSRGLGDVYKRQLQYLTSLKVNRGREEYIRVTLDSEGYRKKREEASVSYTHLTLPTIYSV